MGQEVGTHREVGIEHEHQIAIGVIEAVLKVSGLLHPPGAISVQVPGAEPGANGLDLG